MAPVVMIAIGSVAGFLACEELTLDQTGSPLMPQRHVDTLRSQVRQYPTAAPQRHRTGPWQALVAGLQRMRQVRARSVDLESIRTIGKSSSNITDLVRSASRRLLLFVAGVVAIGAVVCFACYWIAIGRYIESTDDAYVGGEVTTLSFKVAGLIETVAIVDNQSVKTGDLLLKLDDRDYRAQRARAEANIAARQAALANVNATRRMRVAMVEQAMADLATAMADQVMAKQDIDRYRALNNAQVISRQRFEQADAADKKARASVRKAQAALDAVERQLDIVDAQRDQAGADLDQATADRDLARLNLSYTEIRSPIDGVVGNRSARAGAYATVGTQLLAIVPAHGLWVDANFKESQLAGMRTGQPAEITADAVRGVTLRGHVASLAPATGAQFSVIPPENATGNFTKIVQRVPVRILLEDNAAELGRLRPGLSVVVRVDTRQSAGLPVDERPGDPVRDDVRPGAPVGNDERSGAPVRNAWQ
jgi:membrane fusion protein, multidrug efflux system